MAADLKLKAGTGVTLEANGASTAAAARNFADDANLTNSSVLAPFGAFELVITFGTGPTAGRRVTLFGIPLLDGTNPVDGDASVVPSANNLLGFAYVRNVTTAQRLWVPAANFDKRVHLLPFDYKILLQNDADQTISTGWTLKWFPALWQSV